MKSIRLLGSFFVSLVAARAAQPPNVLFLVVDDLRVQLGCYGATSVKSPNIDRLAATGLRFDRAYCQYAICGPSRASLLTGLRPDTLKIENIDTFFRKTVPDVVTLPEDFMQHGYESVYLGKVFHPGQTDDKISWSRRLQLPGGKPGENGLGEPAALEYKLPESLALVQRRHAEAVAKYGAKSNLQGMSGGPAWEAADLPDSAYLDGKIADGAVATLRELKAKGRPFFFGVGFHKPHLPFVAPKKYFDLYDPAKLPLTDAPDPPVNGPAIARQGSFELRTFAGVPANAPIDEAHAREILRAYDACVSFADAQVGRVLAELDALGLRENTIIVLWGDNGWHLGDLGMWGKATDYEVATRVPLIVCVPKMSGAGQSTRALVEFVDVYPSLCELAGVPAPAHLAGRSFVPLLSDPDQPWKEAAFSQFPSPALREWAARPLSPAMRSLFAPQVAALEEKLKQEHGARYDADLFTNHLTGYTVRTDRYRCTLWLDRRDPSIPPYAVELYDHERDPGETVNVADEPRHAAEVKHLADLILKNIRDTWVDPSATPGAN